MISWRGSFGWDDYEPDSGRYDLDWLRRFAALGRRHGIRLRPYLACTPGWAAAGRTAVHLYAETWTPDSVTLERAVGDLGGAGRRSLRQWPCPRELGP